MNFFEADAAHPLVNCRHNIAIADSTLFNIEQDSNKVSKEGVLGDQAIDAAKAEVHLPLMSSLAVSYATGAGPGSCFPGSRENLFDLSNTAQNSFPSRCILSVVAQRCEEECGLLL